MARTILHEDLGIKPEAIEHQLAHRVPDALGSAYNRAQFLAERKAMMQQWAELSGQAQGRSRRDPATSTALIARLQETLSSC